MKQMHFSKTGLFLIELLFALLFFIVAAAICLEVFAKAHTINEESSIKTQAALEAQNIAEIWLQDTDALNTLHIVYPFIEQETNTIFYNNSWQACKKEDSHYKAILENNDEQMKIIMKKESDVLFSMTVQRHTPYVRQVGQ